MYGDYDDGLVDKEGRYIPGGEPCVLCGERTICYFEEFPVCVTCETTRPDDMWALLK